MTLSSCKVRNPLIHMLLYVANIRYHRLSSDTVYPRNQVLSSKVMAALASLLNG